jgi:hypothetical protein
MATYPNLPIRNKDSEQQPVDAITVDEWPNGSARARSYIAPGRYRWTLVHDLLSEANKATLKAFYDANRLRTDISFVSPWDGLTYNNCMIVGLPDYKRLDGPLYDVTVKLRQV